MGISKMTLPIEKLAHVVGKIQPVSFVAVGDISPVRLRFQEEVPTRYFLDKLRSNVFRN